MMPDVLESDGTIHCINCGIVCGRLFDGQSLGPHN
jgi:hypothetical protein